MLFVWTNYSIIKLKTQIKYDFSFLGDILQYKCYMNVFGRPDEFMLFFLLFKQNFSSQTKIKFALHKLHNCAHALVKNI